MARREVTHYFDDLDSTPLDEDTVHIVRFGFEGTDYVLDLSGDNAQEFRRLLEPYVNAARKIAPSRARRRENVNTRAIRAWAREQGIKVADRGKIPHEVIEAYTTARP